MALDASKTVTQQMSGGLPNPAPAAYTIHYNGSLNDWADSNSVSEYAENVGIKPGDAFILTVETVSGDQRKNQLCFYNGATVSICAQSTIGTSDAVTFNGEIVTFNGETVTFTP